jgi:aminoglycoside phosphotransferase (APT) family kinase protein
VTRPQTSTRDIAAVVTSLGHWLRGQLATDHVPAIRVLGGPDGSGFSSDTVLFDLLDTAHAGSYVLRLPPPPDAYPLFPWYDLARQVAAMRLMRERTAVPIPRIAWYEPDAEPLGVPFFVMERVEGLPASDVPPYVLDGWMLETTVAQRLQMEGGVVDGLAAIHGLEASPSELAFLEFDEPGDTALRRHVEHQRTYYDWIRGKGRFPLVDATFDSLDSHWPQPEGPAVVSWGDARIANVLFRDSEPVAFLDWEAVALGPRELDLGWFLYFHDYFQRLAVRLGRPGLPDFLRPEPVLADYAARTGYTPQQMDWYLTYAALRQALTSIRVSSRAVHFGEQPEPADPHDLIMDRAHLEGLVYG